MISIIIPNFNGAKLLAKNLPKVIDGVNQLENEIIVVDDGSTDSSRDMLQKFKDVQVVINEKNLGFIKSVNKGVKNAKGDIVILLNSDVAPTKDFLKPVLPFFKNEKVFAVNFSEPQFSWARASFVDGFVVHHPGPRQDTPHISFWASGGSAAFSTAKWKELGGMDGIYHPFYWEDIDLSYRAAKRGWEIWWEPRSVVIHEHGVTIDKYFNKNFKDYIVTRNQLIFIWKNIADEKMIAEHKKALIAKLVKGEMLKPFLGTLIKLPQILKKRKKEKKEMVITDEQIFAKFI